MILLSMPEVGTLVLVRHGESRWNSCNRFTGWVDVPLSEEGIQEAEKCAHECTKFSFNAVYTSSLERAQETALIILAHQNRNGIFQHEEDPRYKRWILESNQCGGDDIPIYETTMLNERYYGKLQGMEKDAARKHFGTDLVEGWRRGYSNRPPGGETLEEVHARVLPYFFEHILPRIRKKETILVASHENSLRAIIKELEGITDEDITHVNLPTAMPIIYTSGEGDCFTRVAGEYTFSHPNKSVLVRNGMLCFGIKGIAGKEEKE
ncbi:MAG: histidine phosphatase family protein [Patescibacteria group bacterium]